MRTDRGEVFARIGDGTGTPVLLLHGWMATADVNFFSLYRELHGRRPFVAPDLRGHGRSAYPSTRMDLAEAADDVASLLDVLGTGPVHVCGYSMGGAVAQLLASRRRDLVSGLLLSGTALRWNSVSQQLLVRRAGWDGTLQRVTTGRGGARLLARRAAKTSPLSAAVAEWIVAEMERGHPGSLRDAGRSLVRHDGRVLLDQLRSVPSTVVVTADDHLVRPRRQRELAMALGARVVELGADHDAPAARGERWARAVADELDRLDVEPLPATA